MRLVHHEEQPRFQQLMQAHHYLGALRKIGETLWYVASWRAQWVALLSFSAAALKIAARDRWIGWSYRQQYARLKLLANNTRFCVLPSWQRPNVASRTLALCERRLAQDWREAFGHPILLLETFVDGQRHRGTLYQAANWSYVGDTRGYRRIPGGYSATAQSPKKIFVRPLHPKARTLLCQASLEIVAGTAGAKLMLTAQHLRALPQFFKDVPDPRRLAGRRHPLSAVLAIAAGAYLCGARGYKAMGAWAEQLSQSARQGLRCRCERNHYRVPSESIIRDVLLRVDRGDLERALQGWNTRFATGDASLVLQGQGLLSVPALPEA
ncbi:MAG: Druantia anti-phage system protein DruA [Steroidobacteraceae bacterium]